MQDIVISGLFVLLLAAPGIILLVMQPQSLNSRSWLGVPVAAILIVLLGGSMLNQFMGWSEGWGFVIVWLFACALAWWLPVYERNRRGRQAADARLAAPEPEAEETRREG